ncbi:flagellar hook assembly protein FlgD [Rhodobacteraceae bacterium N5(2021)]|uniref:Basal-body rod modification protein FlgD n=1 Tax=Gymnodinialimonas phycosphaerae TaxID=2841589 RepID=A0A975YEX8_9RHOB|nr:flagellar hook capping FlgD N-terminal domain-containing protein [Gymnodinialimonas phycosphaerae]MBY4894080.1 flagellar hook assembly protein FlgD [Gymnodinialimonas phycosphaerae]
MEILSALQTNTSTATAAQDNTTAASITTDFDMFLRLLTTQMQNQDPLNPADSTEYTAQLATFSAVEQQVETNDLLRGLQASFASMNMGQLSGWIGMEARAEMPVNFTGQATTVQIAPNTLADRVELVVRNRAGDVVASTPAVLGDEPFSWDGTGDDGYPLPHDTYTLSAQSWRGEDVLEERAAFVFGEISEAQTLSGEVFVTMENGVTVPADAVQGLRRAS